MLRAGQRARQAEAQPRDAEEAEQRPGRGVQPGYNSNGEEWRGGREHSGAEAAARRRAREGADAAGVLASSSLCCCL